MRIAHTILAGLALGATLAAQVAIPPQCQNAQMIPPYQAENRMVERGPLDYPEIAKRAGLVGTVSLEICVLSDGTVAMADVLDGHAMLRTAAIESAKKTRFRPNPDGAYRSFWPVVFSDGRPPSQVEIESAINRQFFARMDMCREYSQARNPEAIRVCSEAAELSEKLPEDRKMERSGAYRTLGGAQFGAELYGEALRNLEKALAFLDPEANPNNEEVAYAYRDVAMAHHVMRRPTEAAQYYEKAEQQMQRALARAPNIERAIRGITEVYARQLKEIREYYILLLRQNGQSSAAAAVEQRMSTGR